MRISDWSSDVCSSDLRGQTRMRRGGVGASAHASRICTKPASRWWLHIGRHFDMPLPGRRGGQYRQQPGVGHTQQYAEAEAADERRRRTRKQAEREQRSEEHTSELQSLMRNSYAVFCLKKKTTIQRSNISKT